MLDQILHRDGSGEATPRDEYALTVDQALVNDGTGPTAIAALERLGIERVSTAFAVIYVDHNILQADNKSADDHAFLLSAAHRYGLWFSPAGNGVAHPVHYDQFAVPGATLLGADSHTVAAGGLGMLAMGAGGLDVALAMAGHSYHFPRPEVWGVHLSGKLPPGVSAKDVALEMLRRYGVSGATGRVIEYSGDGVTGLSVWDRHTICNMGAELGATASIFPSDATTQRFLRRMGRGDAYRRLAPREDVAYDHRSQIDLSTLVPLVAKPQSPGNVVPVSDVAGTPIAQAYLGSSSNPSYRDFAVAAEMLAGKRCPDSLSLDVNPTTRRVLRRLTRSGHLLAFVEAGARLHQTGCNGCVGLGQAPATGTNSIRTTPRNFPGRSGTIDDSVYLASPETVAASALGGEITDPRALVTEPRVYESEAGSEPDVYNLHPPRDGHDTTLHRGPNIKPLPRFDPLPDDLRLRVLAALGDDVTTDTIMPSSQNELPWRSDIERFSDFVFGRSDPAYKTRARELDDSYDGHCIVAGRNYGQGSSREHAALSPRYLGLRVVFAHSFARIHLRNLANFGVLPLILDDDDDPTTFSVGDDVRLSGIHDALRAAAQPVLAINERTGIRKWLHHQLTRQQCELVLGGGVLEVHTRERPISTRH